ncbi:MAG: hypothetical protein V4722_08280 [Bacteroidota bacterium]
MNGPIIELIGHYSVENQPELSLIELRILRKADEIELSDFTQEQVDEPEENWQSPFSEKYLNHNGDKVIGDDFELPQVLTKSTRLVFFMYFLDNNNFLRTPFGHVDLIGKIDPPQRIKNIIFFENPE